MRNPWIFAAIAALGFAAWWLYETEAHDADSDPRMAVKLTPIDGAAWTRYRNEIKGRTPPSDPMAEDMLAALAEVYDHEARLGPQVVNSKAHRGAVTRFRDVAQAWIDLRGPEGYVELGRHQGLALWESLPAVLTAAETEGVTPAAMIQRASPPPDVARYIAAGGGFLHFAETGGFVVGGRLVEEMAPLAQGLFMDHWLAPMRSKAAVDGQLRAEERRWLYQWRVEHQQGGHPARKLAAVEALSRDPAYPADHNAGVILFQAGHYAEAAARFERSQQPHAQTYAAMAREREEGAHAPR